jgi:hypothetical protein
MTRALISIEKHLQQQTAQQQVWISEADALALLGCSRGKLFQLKSEGVIRAKKVGKANQYSKKSIEKLNELTAGHDNSNKPRRASGADRSGSAGTTEERI